MTHLWKSEETYTFDIPDGRIQDVYGKNGYFSLDYYIRMNNPKVSEVKFDPKYHLVHVIVSVPKYPEDGHPYFTQEDTMTLLRTYMEYANATRGEMREWFDSMRINDESD